MRLNAKPLDDDQIAAAAGMNRVYVNQLCRQLAAEGLIVRQHGANSVLATQLKSGLMDGSGGAEVDAGMRRT